jgi:hypothetical protein
VTQFDELPIFESTKPDPSYPGGWRHFRVGTCKGLWRTVDDSYEILTVINEKKGNGHFKAAMTLFERSCRRDGKKLRIREVWNPWLYWRSVRYHGYKRMRGTLLHLERSFD